MKLVRLDTSQFASEEKKSASREMSPQPGPSGTQASRGTTSEAKERRYMGRTYAEVMLTRSHMIEIAVLATTMNDNNHQ